MATPYVPARRRGAVADALLAAAVVAIVAIMVLPVPPGLLDALIAVNLGSAVVVLLVALHAPEPVAVSAFPSVLLVTTLFRLSLDVAAARLILGRGDAGAVIRAFGQAMIHGNLVVGSVVFAIITLVQYLVIARGAGRVAEVAARFVLDALPGRQLALDAELRAGNASPELATEVRLRRSALARESQFFGAMDGAMRFVRGDAVAGIAVVAVDLAGGLAVGVLQRGLSPAAALARYGTLTVGQGLVAQVPALVTATAAGIVVTRVSGNDPEGSLGSDIAVQFARQPRALTAAAVLLAALAVAPGLPAVPFVFLSVVCAAGAVMATRHGVRPTLVNTVHGFVPVALALGRAHTALTVVASPLATALADRVGALGRELGMELPAVRVTLLPSAVGSTVGTEGREGADEQAVVSIDEVPAATARVACGTAAVDTLADLALGALRDHAGRFMGISEARRLLDGLEREHPSLVREVIPRMVPVTLLAEVLRAMVSEGISVRNLRAVVEALASATGQGERSPGVVTERVRAALTREITHRHAPTGVLAPWIIAPEIEDAVRDAARRSSDGMVADAALAEDVRAAVRRAMGEKPHGAVVLTRAEVRRCVRGMLAAEFPRVTVLAYGELSPGVRITPAGRITP